MKKISFILLITLFACAVSAQYSANDSIITINSVNGVVLYPLVSDSCLNDLTKAEENTFLFGGVIYPLLIVNNSVINDSSTLNCFRNRFDRKKIKKIRHVFKEKAKKMGIQNVPKDGVLFITIDKKYIVDFQRLCQCSPSAVTKKPPRAASF
jgi:ABC-type microcin C transport system permease subunit YejE